MLSRVMNLKIVLSGAFLLSSILITTLGAKEAGGEILYFFSPGCRECAEVEELLVEIEEELEVSLDIQYLDITQGNNIELLWAWEDHTGKKGDGYARNEL